MLLFLFVLLPGDLLISSYFLHCIFYLIYSSLKKIFSILSSSRSPTLLTLFPNPPSSPLPPVLLHLSPLPSSSLPSLTSGVSQVIELEKLLASGGTPDDIRARIEKNPEAVTVTETVAAVEESDKDKEKEKEVAKVEVEKVDEAATPPVETPIVEALPVSVPV
jgi:hypothetical protein